MMVVAPLSKGSESAKLSKEMQEVRDLPEFVGKYKK